MSEACIFCFVFTVVIVFLTGFGFGSWYGEISFHKKVMKSVNEYKNHQIDKLEK